MPPPLPSNRTPRKIDAEDAEMIGDFLYTVGVEVEAANAELRASSLKQADTKKRADYFNIEEADTQYKMGVNIVRRRDGSDKEKEAEVVMNARFKRISNPSVDQSPFNVLFGVIPEAERNRDNILNALRGVEEDLTIPDNIPLFHLGNQRFWAVVEEATRYYVVELGSVNRVRQITDLDDLIEHLRGMHQFLAKQLSKTYGSKD